MFKTSLLLNTTENLTKDKIVSLLEHKDISKKKEGLTNLISLMTQGKIEDTMIELIIKDILIVKNSELTRLFYYYLQIFASIADNSELLMLCNQVRKDLEHPNEFIRGIAMRTITYFNDPELVLNFYKPLVDNFTHCNSYVRRSAYYCVGAIVKKLGIFDDAADLICDALYRDSDPLCLKQGFISLWSINKDLAKKYAVEVKNDRCEELSLIFIEKIDDEKFLNAFLCDDNSKVKLEASLKLIEISDDTNTHNKCIEIMLKEIKHEQVYLKSVLDVLTKYPQEFAFSKYILDLLSYIDPYNLDSSKAILDFILEFAEVSDLPILLGILNQKYEACLKMTLKNKKICYLILDHISEIVYKHCYLYDSIVETSVKNIVSDDPEIAYASLKILFSTYDILSLEKRIDGKYESILITIVDSLFKVKYGKIFRNICELFVKHATSAVFNAIIEKLDKFANDNVKDISHTDEETKEEIKVHTDNGGVPYSRYSFNTSATSPFGSSNKVSEKNGTDIANGPFLKNSQSFLIPFICITLSHIYKRFEPDMEVKARVLAIMMKFLKAGESKNVLDHSSKDMVIACIRSLLKDVPLEKELSSYKYRIQNIGVLEPLEIYGASNDETSITKKMLHFLESRENSDIFTNVVQLTGLSDPVYIEANVIYKSFEIILDFLLINQTDFHLQDMLFDFGTSRNIRPLYISMPNFLAKGTAVTKQASFRILDNSTGYITGSVSFKYPNDVGEYANHIYNLNFSEVKITVSNFLEKKAYAPEKFKEQWRKMEWENIYNVRFLMNSSCSVKDFVFAFKDKVCGSVVDFYEANDYYTVNISCTTRQNSDILFNLCLFETDNHLNLECRIRSHQEDVVKSLSDIVGSVVKLFKKNK